MTRQRVLQIIREVKPQHVAELKLHMKCRKLGYGCSREVFELPGNLVIKFPMSGRACALHSRKDVTVPKMLQSRVEFRALRRYCPKVFYSTDQGVVVMEKLKMTVTPAQSEIIDNIFIDIIGRSGLDINPTNMGHDARGQIKILDFGCFIVRRRK